MNHKLILFALLCAIGSLLASAEEFRVSAGDGGVVVSVDSKTANYTILVDGKVWFTSGPTAVHAAGVWYTSQKNLQLKGVTSTSGQGKLGSYKQITIDWETSSSIPVQTTIQAYAEKEIVLFTQNFPKGLPSPAYNSTDDVITSFPTIPTSSPASLYYYTHHGTFAYPHIGSWVNNPAFPGGAQGGPITFYNSKFRTLRFSAFNDFMASQQTISKSLGHLAFGFNAKLKAVPAGYSHTTLLIGGQGITDSIYEWGSVLLGFYGKKRATVESDLLIKTLGYWTDNGGAYWYDTEPNKNYEQTMLDLNAYIKQTKIPYTHIQLDSWWYPKGKNGGVTLWESMPSVFPDGIAEVAKKLGYPLALHNRYFAPDSPYVANFSMIVEDYCALPTNEALFDHIMEKAASWGMILYEQDWLVTTYTMMEATQNDLNNAKNWLKYMGNAAAKLNLTIQYCMPLPNHLLQSVEIQTVTQSRASGDYQPSNDQWNIFHTSQLIWSLGMFPFKDDFWTTSEQPGCHISSYRTCVEPNPVLETLVAALSAGPVGPSDEIGKMNKDLIMKTCRASGDLLKPDVPAFPLDSTFLPVAPSTTPDVIKVASTYTSLANHRWHFLLGADLATAFTVHPADLPQFSGAAKYFDYFATVNTSSIHNFDSQNPIKFPAKTGEEITSSGPNPIVFHYYVIAPVLESGWVFLGETSKFITVSKQRISSITSTSTGLTIELIGTSTEVVTLSLLNTAATSQGVKTFTVTLGTTGRATLSCDKTTCKF